MQTVCGGSIRYGRALTTIEKLRLLVDWSADDNLRSYHVARQLLKQHVKRKEDSNSLIHALRKNSVRFAAYVTKMYVACGKVYL